MVKVLKKGRMTEAKDASFLIALEGLRDILILDFALSQLSSNVDRTVMQEKLRRIIKDPVHPQDDLKKSPGRDFQTELYAAAVAMKGKLCPRFEEPPDVLCDLAGEPLGIAVKRVKNETQFEKRFREAVRQIEKAKVRGVVVMDLSLAFNRANQPINTPASIVEIQLAHCMARKLFVDERHTQMKEWIAGRPVRGLVIIDHVLRHHPSEGWFLETFHFDVPFDLHNQRRRREFEEFRSAFKRGYATPVILDT